MNSSAFRSAAPSKAAEHRRIPRRGRSYNAPSRACVLGVRRFLRRFGWRRGTHMTGSNGAWNSDLNVPELDIGSSPALASRPYEPTHRHNRRRRIRINLRMSTGRGWLQRNNSGRGNRTTDHLRRGRCDLVSLRCRTARGRARLGFEEFQNTEATDFGSEQRRFDD